MDKYEPRSKATTSIPNRVLDAIIGLRCSSIEKSILLAVCRMTYGENVNQVAIGNAALAKLVGSTKEHVARAVAFLIYRRILISVFAATPTTPRILCLNDDVFRWWLIRDEPRHIEPFNRNDEGKVEDQAVDATGNESIDPSL